MSRVKSALMATAMMVMIAFAICVAFKYPGQVFIAWVVATVWKYFYDSYRTSQEV